MPATALDRLKRVPYALWLVSKRIQRGRMKILIVAMFTLLIASAGGGDGLGKSDDTQFLVAGGRGGLVLTGEHLPGILRGNFEWAVDVMPAYIVFPPERGIYGASIKPFLWEWNFTHWQKVAPFWGVAGGALFTLHNIPPGDTSSINFTPQIDMGVHVLTRE